MGVVVNGSRTPSFEVHRQTTKKNLERLNDAFFAREKFWEYFCNPSSHFPTARTGFQVAVVVVVVVVVVQHRAHNSRARITPAPK
jgi:hypothetical protein